MHTFHKYTCTDLYTDIYVTVVRTNLYIYVGALNAHTVC